MSPPVPRDRTAASQVAQLREQVQKIDRRLDTVERNASDLAKSVGALAEETAAQARWRRELELVAAREEERDKALYQRLDSIDKQIEEVREESRAAAKEVRGVWVRVQWIIITTVIGGIVGWLVMGRFPS